MEQMTKQNLIPEAVASVTYTLETPNGFGILFTVRGDSGVELLKNMKEVIEPQLIKDGYKPQSKYGGKQPKQIDYVEGRVCPTCGKRLVKGVTKDGRSFVKCETQNYDFKTRQKTGCPYFNFE